MALGQFFVLLLFFAPLAASQQDFLSVDCGLDDDSLSGYKDPDTGIEYVSDSGYIDAGENHMIAPELVGLWGPVRYDTLRSFPSGKRNCYALPAVAGSRYLVRAFFTYGNYDGKNSSSLQFDLHLGANYWETVYPDATRSFAREAIFVAWADTAPFCLVNTGRGAPFVSVLELRPLGDMLYSEATPGLILSRYTRLNMGASNSITQDLSYNNLSGSIPDSLPSLPSLRVLNVSGNQLNEDSLCKNYTKSLIFRHDSSLCNNPSSGLQKNKVAIIATSVVVPLLVVVALLTYFIWWKKRKSNVQPLSTLGLAKDPQHDDASGSIQSHGDNLKKTENRRFTYKELEKFTNNFNKSIGQGGFGPVYYGRLEDNTEVAVKMHSKSSSHGLNEFLAEVQSLKKVHHRNLVALIGYCWEEDQLALIYEYMSQGSLFDHLRGKNGTAETLNWRTRVQIVLEAAQGLDYLHKGCNLPIVHGDMKTSNILLDQNLQAKIADFGLSKTYISDTQTHVSVTPAGTTGYMDPEHYLTGRLTESSDVYSFGVVLLEVATGEPPVVSGRGHIIQRVRQNIATGDISSVADKQLRSAYDISSMWKVIDTAMMCTRVSAAQRPTMATVVIELKESLALEEARAEQNYSSIEASRENDDDIEAMVSTFRPMTR